jgi:hypothetical protein
VREVTVIGFLHQLGNQFRSTTRLQDASHRKPEVAEQRKRSSSEAVSIRPEPELDFMSVTQLNQPPARARVRRNSSEDMVDLEKTG